MHDTPLNPNRLGRPVVFWIGMLLISVGVLLAFQSFLGLRASPGAPYVFTTRMAIALPIDVLGTCLAVFGILPRGWLESRRQQRAGALSPPLSHREAETPLDAVASQPARAEHALGAMNAAPLNRKHWAIIARMYAGLVIDTMKPATLGFMLPGMREEYGLSPAVVSLFPLAAVIGLTLGSVLFGMLGDLIGRRASFVLASLILATTALCGFMPGYPWHLSTCFLMGLAAGGELPLIYTMLAETMPARHRGWSGVALGGIGGLSGYLVASLLAGWLEPAFSWRVLWLPNLPTAILMLGLLRWVNESPRFLLQMGLVDEARRTMAKMGVAVGEGVGTQVGAAVNVRDLLGPLRGTTTTLCLFGFAWGLCNWGFITWLPDMLRNAGFDPGLASRLLSLSALCALPATCISAFTYGFWSSRWTAVVSASATAIVLLAFSACAPYLPGREGLVIGLTAALLVASSSMIGVLAPYSVELYPTALRGLGSGVVTGSSKSGGIVGPPLVGVLLTMFSSASIPALAIAIPVAFAAIGIAWRGTETRGRTLEELEQMTAVAMPPSTGP